MPVTILIAIAGKILHLPTLLGDAPVKTFGPDAPDVGEGSSAVFPFLSQSEGSHHVTGPLDMIGVGANQERSIQRGKLPIASTTVSTSASVIWGKSGRVMICLAAASATGHNPSEVPSVLR